ACLASCARSRSIGMREKVTPVTAWHGAMWNHLGEGELAATQADRMRLGAAMGYGHAISGTALSRPSSANVISDAALVGRIANGERDAMRLLFIRHNLRIFRFLLRIVGNDATAEDLLNDVFLEVWRRADRFKARSQVTTWLLGIARFKALSAL